MDKKQALKVGGMLLALGLVVLSIGISIHFYLSYQDTKQALDANLSYYLNKTTSLEEENEWLKGELNRTIQKLNNTSTELALLKSNLTQLSQLYNQCLSRPPQIIEKIKIVNPLNFSEWFKGMNLTNDYVFEDIARECSTVGEIILPCVAQVLKQRHIYYTTMPPDPFLNVEQALREGRGDCEEFGVVEMAFLNRYKEVYPDKRIELMRKAGPLEVGTFYSFKVGNNSYKLSGYTSMLMGLVGDYYYGVACYNVNQTQGHCALAISLKPLRNVSDFNGARLVDVENGEFLGIVGKDYFLCDGDCSQPNVIWVLVYDKLARWDNGWKYN